MSTEFFVAKREGYSQARRHERVPVDFAVAVRTDGLRLTDRARDVSEAGIRVDTDEPLPPMSLITLVLALPREPEPVAVLGRVMWSGASTMGIRFEQSDRRLTDVVHRLRSGLQAI